MNQSRQQIYLIRHGETQWSLSGQHTGMTNIPLTENGRKAAERFKPVFAKMDLALILTSPLKRAQTTCELAGFGERCEIEPDLMEWNYGAYEGLTSKEIHAQSPHWIVFKDGCPGGETPKEVGERADRVIARARAAKGDVALFAHGHILRVLAARYLELPVAAGCHFLLDTATLSILSYYKENAAIKQWNAALPS